MRYEVEQTEGFVRQHQALRNLRARIAIARRLEHVAAGTFGDVKPVD